MSLPIKLEEFELKEDCQPKISEHSYHTVRITGVYNAYGFGLHFVVEVQHCIICESIKVISWMTNEWHGEKFDYSQIIEEGKPLNEVPNQS